ncbi:hypothetical protein SAMN06265784_117109 [Paraburkholderia susongensis]|uniref:Uncharacterized protein n=1 Tax=Paraburkholderia susongensis TaxID=1515439 RepID=A0A1X7M3V9_9BURK|nr:hypothetical protein SAMN06265784_117109 [Paraburkholderia susongensis]
MRSDDTAVEFAQPQPLASAPLDGAGKDRPQRLARTLTRVAFCFAWFFGLEPFLAAPADDAPARHSQRSP